MKCKKCQTELFGKDVVDGTIRFFNAPGSKPTDRSVECTSRVYRCPKCFTVRRGYRED